MKDCKGYIALITVCCTLTWGCSVTKFVDDRQYLLNSNRIVVREKTVDRAGIENQIRQKENQKIFGLLKVHLYLYNLSSGKRAKSFFRRIGEAPVIYDENLKNQSKFQIEQYLKNKGFYDVAVETETRINGKKADVIYYITPNRPYRIGKIDYQIKDPNLEADFTSSLEETLLKVGDLLDVDNMVKERIRLARSLNEKGYFKFSEDYIYYQIDTLESTHLANIDLVVEKAQNPATSKFDSPHKRYYINTYHIAFEEVKRDSLAAEKVLDGVLVNDRITYFYDGKMPLRPSLMSRSIENKPGSLYSKKADERTYINLYGLRQFRFVNLSFSEDTSRGDSLTGYLNGRLYLPLQNKQSYSIDLEGTNTSGNYGIAGNLNYRHRNLFKGAQQLEVTFRGATERQVAEIDNQYNEFLVRELGAEAKFYFPGFILPFYEDRLKLRNMPQTRFSMAYSYMERPYFTRTIANATYGYRWKSLPFYTHSFNPIDLSIIRVPYINPVWASQIKDLYIRNKYNDHLIYASNYTLIFSNKSQNKKGQYRYLKSSIEMAGNTLWAVSSLFNFQKFYTEESDQSTSSTYYQLFGVRFAQYIKGDIEFRKSIRLGENQSLAWRTFGGVALPYGNLNVVPFERSYYAGGSNGIRAWQVRSLGPGSYSPSEDEYPNQSSDIKLEANIEYRFKMFWMLEGALFFDGGNIWSISGKDNREGAVFRLNTFYKEFALGTGLGVRLIAPFFIIRADLGLKLRDPALDGNRWIPAVRPFERSDLGLNIAVDYPF